MATAIQQLGHVTRDKTFEETFEQLSARYQARWWRTSTELPDFGPQISRRRQRSNERQINRFADRFEDQLPSLPEGRAKRRVWSDQCRATLREFGRDVLLISDAECRVIFSDEYFEATAQFSREARSFDPELEIHDLSQALRNVWIMYLLQLLLDRPLRCTRPVLAYSLLYPYTDNYLDDPDVASMAKRRFGERLGDRLRDRLSGGRLLPENPHERSVFRLIGMIEEAWPRHEFPEVHDSLLAIHRAQIQSLVQHQRALCSPEILRISVEKGGSSVLADGYLVAGQLSPEEADFIFGYGVFLQLADDLQDLTQDLRSGAATLFSPAAGRPPLDHLVNRLVHFLDFVLASRRFSARRFDTLRAVIRNNCVRLIVQSVAEHPSLFSRSYLRTLERHSLTRFSYLRKQRDKLQGRYRRLNQRISQKTLRDSVFEALG